MSLGGEVNKYLNKLLDIIFVSNIYCIGCGAIIDKSRKYSLCNDCMENMAWTSGKVCEQCGRTLGESSVIFAERQVIVTTGATLVPAIMNVKKR